MQPKRVLVDLEGTLVEGKSFEPIHLAREFVEWCTVNSVPIRVVSNNTTELPEKLSSRLRELGFKIEQSEITTPLSVLREFLPKGKKVFLVGGDAIRETIEQSGCITSHRPSGADFVVVGGGAKFEDSILDDACNAVASGACLVALHRNRLFVDQSGQKCVGLGGYIAALEYATNSHATCLGKPERAIYENAMGDFTLDSSTWFLSDDPFSDLAGAESLQLTTVFLLTGKYGREVLPALSFAPSIVATGFEELLQILEVAKLKQSTVYIKEIRKPTDDDLSFHGPNLRFFECEDCGRSWCAELNIAAIEDEVFIGCCPRCKSKNRI